MPPITRSQNVREAEDKLVTPSHDFQGRRNDINLRQRTAAKTPSSTTDAVRRNNEPDEPPRFSINLSLPPEQRYLELCSHFEDEMMGLISLFDDVVSGITRFIPVLWLHRICRLFLRRVYDKEENDELKGISKATRMPMYLLVCFNVLLDLFMGCSSGGAAVRDGRGGSKMVHFRTLDWGMDPLRGIVVQLDFKIEADGPIIASSITYAGYVGVLTGVRKDLSLSLNFRPNRHNKGVFWQDVLYYWHLLMVLLGRRRSISSELRRFLLPTRETLSRLYPNETSGQWRYWRCADIVTEVGGLGRRPLTTTACYLCFSDGQETTVFEKDRVTALSRQSNDFVVVTNNDLGAEKQATVEDETAEVSELAAALAEIVGEAKDRRQCAEHNHHNMRAKKAKALGMKKGAILKSVLDIDDVIELVQRFPTTNECTHYACVLDAQEGKVVWCRRWLKPVGAKWIRAHKSDTW